ncbi:minor extracellular protease vpr protein [Ceratobasidium sp. AG-Ba]|nr:minor extracellular protease vpr protein [Ceratobasidium sp. AG-Ba]
MKPLLALLLVKIVFAAVDIQDIQHHSRINAIPRSYIVRLDRDSHLKRGIALPHAEFYRDLQKRAACWNKIREYVDDLFTGVALTVCTEEDLLKLSQVSGVEAIYPNFFHSVPKLTNRATIHPDAKTVTANRFSPHIMTGVDKVHARGYFGKGITVGIVDTGIDYTHPALGGGFGPGHKIIGGYDFVGDAYTGLPGSPDPEPDNDPLDQCFGHGTHVAGIIGANPDNPYNISGVAYEASINAYRVVGCTGGYTDDVLLDALTRAYNDGNHIITLSLGEVDGWSEGVTSVLASEIADKGRIVTIAAGNDGAYGAWYTSGPANGLSTISVGSVDNTVINIQNAAVSTGHQIPYLSFIPLNITGSLPIYATSNDTTTLADACDPLPSTTPDLSKYLVLIRRGTCAFIQKLSNAAAFGAKYFLVYDNVDRPLSSVTFGNYTAALISQQDGKYLIDEAVPQKATIAFGNNPSTILSPTGGLMSSFSTYGPTYDMFFKPALSAPGGNILSTMPMSLGSYAVESGTSMATPFVAGCAALWLQVLGPTVENAKAARTVFQNTASFVPVSNSTGSLLETVSRSGAGLIQIYNAIYNSGRMLPGELLLNDTSNFQSEHVVTIRNGNNKTVAYTLTHIPSGTAPTINGIENLRK